ncbi:MAG: hypothetical protein FWD47_02530 [Treponema sp.]|nr:hypothetical protein [Treponema sp.]
MKGYLFLLILPVFPVLIFAQSLSFVPNNTSYGMAPANTIYFLPDNIISFTFLHEPEQVMKTGTYTVDMSNGIPFINVKWEDNKTERFLIISNENILNVYTTAGQLFDGTQGRNLRGSHETFLYHIADKISASSYLVEAEVSYQPTQFNRPPFQPLWIEGAGDHGIHEKLFIQANTCFALHISIGFVSYTTPQLYLENSRPKKIRLYVDNYFSIDVDLEDTPNYQIVYLPNPLRKNDVLELEILEVYPGTKYADTCINNIYYDYVPFRDFNSASGFDYIPWQNWNFDLLITEENSAITSPARETEITTQRENTNTTVNIMPYNTEITSESSSGKSKLWLLFLLFIPLLAFIVLLFLKKRK